MDFFEAQAHAKKFTGRLIALFVLAVIGTIIAVYFVAIFVLSTTKTGYSYRDPVTNREIHHAVEPLRPWQPWQPDILAGVAIITVAVVGIASSSRWQSLCRGGRMVTETAGGRCVKANSTGLAERRVLDIVEEMAIAAGMPMPAVYVLDDEPAINAFASGLTTHDAVVTVTRGALDKLNRDELQGIIGHEFSHILNGDMRFNLKLAATIYGLLIIGLAGRFLATGNIKPTPKNPYGIGLSPFIVVGLPIMAIGFIGYFTGRLIQAAVSREREFLADAASVQFTRNPTGLTNALKKIGGDEFGSVLKTRRATEFAHFFFAQVFETSFVNLWSTHPPLEARIRALDPNWEGKFVAPSRACRRSENTES